MREMRRKDRAVDEATARALLEKAEYGVLSTVSEDGTAYGVPVNHVLVENSIYFHCAMEGHKIDNMRHEAMVSFCVVGEATPVYRDDFTTTFESAIAFGRAAEVKDDKEKIRALHALCKKVLPDHMQNFAKSLEGSLSVTGVWRIDITHITGKKRA